MIICHEWRAFGTSGYLLRALPLALLVPLAALWPHIGSPFAPAFIGALLVVEPCFNNTLALQPTMFAAYGATPVAWRRVLRAKNIAAMLATIAASIVYGALVAFVLIQPPTIADCALAGLYLWSILFPMAILGNSVSLQHLQVRAGWTLDDASAAITMLLSMMVLSLPFLILGGSSLGRAVLGAYGASAGLFWYVRSVPASAQRIHTHFPTLWQILNT